MHISETMTKIVIDNNQTIVLNKTQMRELRDLLNKQLDPLAGYNTHVANNLNPTPFAVKDRNILEIPCSSIDVGVVQFPTDEKYITGNPVFDNQNYGCITGDAVEGQPV